MYYSCHISKQLILSLSLSQIMCVVKRNIKKKKIVLIYYVQLFFLSIFWFHHVEDDDEQINHLIFLEFSDIICLDIIYMYH